MFHSSHTAVRCMPSMTSSSSPSQCHRNMLENEQQSQRQNHFTSWRRESDEQQQRSTHISVGMPCMWCSRMLLINKNLITKISINNRETTGFTFFLLLRLLRFFTAFLICFYVFWYFWLLAMFSHVISEISCNKKKSFFLSFTNWNVLKRLSCGNDGDSDCIIWV